MSEDTFAKKRKSSMQRMELKEVAPALNLWVESLSHAKQRNWNLETQIWKSQTLKIGEASCVGKPPPVPSNSDLLVAP